MMRLIVFLLTALSANAANVYIRWDATGAGTGNDWTDALTAFPSMARGNTYYVADGEYAGGTWNTATNADTRILVRKATAANHGTDTGWLATMGDGQCVITNPMIISSGYWTLDGQVGDYWGSTAYGIKIKTGTVFGQPGMGINFYAGHGCTVQYVEVSGPGGDTTEPINYVAETTGITAWGGGDNVLISHCYIHGFSTIFDSCSNWTIEHSILKDVRNSNTDIHPNIYYIGYGTTNVDFRFNFCLNYDDEGVFLTYYNGCPSNIRIYGNVFHSPGTHYSRGIEFRPQSSFTNIYIFNNTFGELSLGSAIDNRVADDPPYGVTVGCVISNNISYLSSFVDFGDITNQGANVEVFSDPFVAIGTNFRLKAAHAGTVLQSPYNVDITGATRGADGVFDIGAYEYSTSPSGRSTAKRVNVNRIRFTP